MKSNKGRPEAIPEMGPKIEFSYSVSQHPEEANGHLAIKLLATLDLLSHRGVTSLSA